VAKLDEAPRRLTAQALVRSGDQCGRHDRQASPSSPAAAIRLPFLGPAVPGPGGPGARHWSDERWQQGTGQVAQALAGPDQPGRGWLVGERAAPLAGPAPRGASTARGTVGRLHNAAGAGPVDSSVRSGPGCSRQGAAAVGRRAELSVQAGRPAAPGGRADLRAPDAGRPAAPAAPRRCPCRRVRTSAAPRPAT
jgi:hypothetical protein